VTQVLGVCWGTLRQLPVVVEVGCELDAAQHNTAQHSTAQ
jgi:hypothetical protein